MEETSLEQEGRNFRQILRMDVLFVEILTIGRENVQSRIHPEIEAHKETGVGEDHLMVEIMEEKGDQLGDSRMVLSIATS